MRDKILQFTGIVEKYHFILNICPHVNISTCFKPNIHQNGPEILGVKVHMIQYNHMEVHVEISGQPFHFQSINTFGTQKYEQGVSLIQKLSLRSKYTEHEHNVLCITLRRINTVSSQPTVDINSFGSIVQQLLVSYVSPNIPPKLHNKDITTKFSKPCITL